MHRRWFAPACSLVASLGASGCDRKTAPSAAPPLGVDAGVTPIPVVAPAALGRATSPTPAPIASATAGLDDDLKSEEREANPRSETVKIKLVVVPAVDAVVWWGGKKLGVAGKATLEIERPRASGPMDVTVRAQGFLPYHTRLFTDRDDRLSVRLVRPEEAVGMLGYRPATGPKPEP